jgi:hypothetical protein
MAILTSNDFHFRRVFATEELAYKLLWNTAMKRWFDILMIASFYISDAIAAAVILGHLGPNKIAKN